MRDRRPRATRLRAVILRALEDHGPAPLSLLTGVIGWRRLRPVIAEIERLEGEGKIVTGHASGPGGTTRTYYSAR